MHTHTHDETKGLDEMMRHVSVSPWGLVRNWQKKKEEEYILTATAMIEKE